MSDQAVAWAGEFKTLPPAVWSVLKEIAKPVVAPGRNPAFDKGGFLSDIQVHSKLGVFYGSVQSLCRETAHATNTVRAGLATLEAVGILVRGNQQIAIRQASRPQWAGRAVVYELNDRLSGAIDGDWIGEAAREILLHEQHARRRASSRLSPAARYGSKDEAIAALVPAWAKDMTLPVGGSPPAPGPDGGEAAPAAPQPSPESQPESPIPVSTPAEAVTSTSDAPPSEPLDPFMGVSPEAVPALDDLGALWDAAYAAISSAAEADGAPTTAGDEETPGGEPMQPVLVAVPGGQAILGKTPKETPEEREILEPLRAAVIAQMGGLGPDGKRVVGNMPRLIRTSRQLWRVLAAEGYTSEQITAAWLSTDEMYPSESRLRSVLRGRVRTRGAHSTVRDSLRAVIDGGGRREVDSTEEDLRQAFLRGLDGDTA